MADRIEGEDRQGWKKRHPEGTVISYVNTDAQTKAAADICCTSANAVKVAEAVADGVRGEGILFVPDRNPGVYVTSVTVLRMELWKGCFHVQERITSRQVEEALGNDPEA